MTTPRAYALDNQLAFSYDGGHVIELYDLVYHDADDIKRASTESDLLSAAPTRREFVDRFAGVALEAKSAAHGADAILPVAREFIGEFDCDSSAWEVGDLVTIASDGEGDLLPQQLAKTLDPSLAIGHCVRRSGAAASRVRVRLASRVSPIASYGPAVASLVSQPLLVASFADGGSTSGSIDFAGAELPAGAIVLGWEANVTGAFAGDTSAVIQVGVDGDPDKFTADTTQSAFTAGRRGSAAAPATAWQAAAAQPRVTVTSASDFTSVVSNGGGAMTVTLYFLPFAA